MRKVMASRDPSHHSLSETIHSLLGLKSHLTSTWVQSVCDIITNLPPHCPQPQGQPTDLTTINLETDTSSDTASKIRGKSFHVFLHMFYSDVLRVRLSTILFIDRRLYTFLFPSCQQMNLLS